MELSNTFNSTFAESFSCLEDSRYKNKRHLLLYIIALCICGIMSGMKDFIEIAEFAEVHEDWFKKYLVLPNGIPSHDTLERVIAILNPSDFNKSFLNWISKLKALMQNMWVS